MVLPTLVLAMKVAIVHDWLTGVRGGEKALEAICELYPGATVYTLFHFKGSAPPLVEKMKIETSFIQGFPFLKGKYRYYLPFFPMAIEKFDLRGYDLVISSSHCVAKGVIPPSTALHVSYVHTPVRYAWELYHDYFGGKRGSAFLSKLALPFAHYLRFWDVVSSSRVDDFVANSRYVAKRIERYYRRRASVIYPPVDTRRFYVSQKVEDYYLAASAFAPYKRLDIAIEAFNRLGLKLRIAGWGPEEKRLKKIAGPTIEFLGRVSDSELSEHYSKCIAFILPGEEDFGIAPVEAMASGRPVLAYARGGALESVPPLGKAPLPAGVFFYEQTRVALIGAVRLFEKNYTSFDPASIRNLSLRFDRGVFKDGFKRHIEERLKEFYSVTPGAIEADVKREGAVF